MKSPATLSGGGASLASAPAIAPIVSLDRCMAFLQLEQLEADSAGFRALSAHATPKRLLRILWHQSFELRLRALVLDKGQRTTLSI